MQRRETYNFHFHIQCLQVEALGKSRVMENNERSEGHDGDLMRVVDLEAASNSDPSACTRLRYTASPY